MRSEYFSQAQLTVTDVHVFEDHHRSSSSRPLHVALSVDDVLHWGFGVQVAVVQTSSTPTGHDLEEGTPCLLVKFIAETPGALTQTSVSSVHIPPQSISSP